jgi:hypothetical protein
MSRKRRRLAVKQAIFRRACSEAPRILAAIKVKGENYDQGKQTAWVPVAVVADPSLLQRLAVGH